MKAIVFDFDGTIGDSFDYVLEYLASKAGVNTKFNIEQKKVYRGLSMKDLALKLGIPYWRLASIYFEGRASMTAVMSKEHPFKGIAEVLAALHEQGYQLFILSSNSRQNIEKFLTAHGLAHYFSQIYGSAAILGKAHAIKGLLKQHNLSVENTIYVGDETRDVKAAKRLSLDCIAVSWGFGSSTTLHALEPLQVVDNPVALQQALQQWGSVN